MSDKNKESSGDSALDNSLRVEMLKNSVNSDTNKPRAFSSEIDQLEVGTVNFRLHLPGLFDILIPVPAPAPLERSKYLREFYDQFKDKYWTVINKKHKCLICSEVFHHRDSIMGHLNRHLGYYMYRCPKCTRGFYVHQSALNHCKNCFRKP